MKTAQKLLAAADIMVEFNNIEKLIIFTKSSKIFTQTENVNLMNELIQN